MLTVNLSGSKCPVDLSKQRLSMTTNRVVNSKGLSSAALHSLSFKMNLPSSRDAVLIISIDGLSAEGTVCFH